MMQQQQTATHKKVDCSFVLFFIINLFLFDIRRQAVMVDCVYDGVYMTYYLIRRILEKSQ